MEPSDPQQQRSWRAAVRGEPKRGGGPIWRREETAAVPATGLASRKVRLAAVLAGLGILGGLLIWVSFWLWPFKSASLILIGSGYETNLAVPANIYGWQALQDLADVTQNNQLASFWGERIIHLRHSPRDLQVGDAWDRDLDSVRERTVMVYFGLHGGVDAQGAYLLPGNADVMDRPENRIRLSAIIERLGKLPANKYKLLVLDSTAIGSQWSLGMLTNDLARELSQLEPQIVEVPNLVVLCASAPDQSSWSSPEWRQTIFGHYFIEGLKGAAGDEDGDSRSSVLDLFNYLRPNVENWVWANRQAWQTPMLLPSGELGMQRARQIDLAFTRPYQPPDPEQTPVFEPPPELVRAWQNQEAMMKQLPPPASYAPQLWRQYQDTLLRYEELLRGNSLVAASQLASRLSDLEQELKRQSRLDLTSMQNNLAMPAVAGYVLPPLDAVLRRQFDDLWNAAPADAVKLWKQLQAGAATNVRVLRYHACQYLLDRALDNPVENLQHVSALLRVIADPVRPQPIEAHFAIMLQRDLANPPPPLDLLQLGLRMMMQGEQAALAAQQGIYPYSEHVYPWLQEQIRQADEQRRLGQDLLFASEPESWTRARQFLESADRLYRQAQASGAVVRNALGIRDHVLMRLPYYSHWVIRRRIFDDPHHDSDDELTAGIRSLWKDTHELVRLLEKPDPALLRADADGASPLGRLAESIQKTFARLEQDFLNNALALSDFDLQFILRHTENTLSVPYLPAGLRMQLLTNLAKSSRQLLIQMSRNINRVRPFDADRYEDWFKQQARARGQMALAVLGQPWYDECAASQNGENFQLASHRLATFQVESKWWESLARVGEGVGLCYRRFPEVINEQVAKAKSANILEARGDLQIADRLSRQITGAESLLLTGNPAEIYRNACMVGLLFWQADRSLQDHWFAADPAAPPYYRVTGQLFINDARTLDPRPLQGPAKVEFQTLQAKFDQSGRLLLAGPLRRDLTSDQTTRLAYLVEPGEGAAVPPGYPVFWLEAGKGLELLAPSGTGRLVRRIGTAPGVATNSLVCDLASPLLRDAEANPPPTPQPIPTALALRGVYRGQRIEQVARINLYPLADVTVREVPLPDTGRVAVRASKEVMARFGASNGHIALVLDCSGSMGPPAGQPYGPTTKYNEALAALRQVLQRLPKGATVSLWAFGQATGPGKTVREAEKTIRRIQEPIRWDPEDPNQLKSLMAKVQYPTLEPWNETPLVRTLVMAKGDLQGAPGFKTIVAITDGMDNRFATDAQLNPNKRDIPTFLTETFRDSGIVLNIVGYKVVSQEAKQAEAQFKVVETWPLPGRFVTVNDVNTLADSLGQAFAQSLEYWVDREDNVPVTGSKNGVGVSPLGANDQWFPTGLQPALYKLRVLTDQRLLKTISIGRGDLLLVNLVQSATGGVAFERGLWTLSDYPWKPSVTKQNWRLTVLQNQAVGERGLQMLTALEKVPDPREAILQVLRPRHIWLEVAPAGNEGAAAAPYAVRWGNLPGYPAPTWSIDVPAWPGSGKTGLARPALRAWWNPDQELIPSTRLDHGADFQAIADLAGRAIPVAGSSVMIEGVTLETHLVETKPGVKESQPCLVVRLSHPPGQPVTVAALGLSPAGHEHRYFTQIGQTTTLFWPASKANIDNLASLAFYSVNSFKSDAERRGFYAEMPDLKTPEPSDVRPRMPIPLQ